LPAVPADRSPIMDTFLRCTSVVVLSLLAGPVGAAVPAAHLQADCASCHRFERTATMPVEQMHSTACAQCHAPAGVAAARGSDVFHAASEGRCTSCHSFHEPDRVRIPVPGGERAEESTLSLASIARTPEGTLDLVQCTPCHRNGGPSPTLLHPGHQAAGDWYHRNVAIVGNQSISESCLRCHDRDQPVPDEVAEFSPPRPARSANHVTGARVTRRGGGGYGTKPPTDPRLPLVNGHIECTTCHDLYNDSDDMLARFEPRDEMCLGCHVRTIDDSSGRAVALSR
jgi:hypothetical protein